MHRAKRISITDLNEQLTCRLCKGYFIDATTIVECLHTFCRSCIVQYLKKNKYCPVCDVQVHKTKPLLNIRPDKTLQDIVYKLVPRLFHNEMQRRREFYDNHPEAEPTNTELYSDGCYQHLLTPEETVCLTLNYYGCSETTRYLRCPAAVSIGHLKKLIQAKYDLNDNHRVEILYNQDCLKSSLTLMDIACIYVWKRKGPIELKYRIYECTSKKLKLDAENLDKTQSNNNNNWKEVQLRISENGEMSITGIQDSHVVDVVNSEKYKSEIVTVVESNSNNPVTTTSSKRELPELKYIGKNSPTNISSNAGSTSPRQNSVNTTASLGRCVSTSSHCSTQNAVMCIPNSQNPIVQLPVEPPSFSSACATLSSATTTTVFSTINTTKCSTKTDDDKDLMEKNITENSIKLGNNDNEVIETDKKIVTSLEEPTPLITNNNVVASCDKGIKRKNENSPEHEQAPKQQKQTILNHSMGLLNLSNNHPLKKHSKMNRNGENTEKPVEKTTSVELDKNDKSVSCSSTATTSSTITIPSPVVVFSKPSVVTKNVVNTQTSRPGTPITLPKTMVTKYQGGSQPCYMPKTSYNPVITVPKPTTSNSNLKTDVKSPVLPKSEVKPPTSRTETKTSPSMSTQNAITTNNKLNIKSKASTPIGYKTLRDPPKSWNSQISRANLNKPLPDPKYSDLKNVRPAKFFKMRNNMPRYLGNPASGVKPMYQVNVSPDKDKNNQDGNKIEKSEIKKHSIVKIDPKTLKPISEKAPETTSLSNQSDLKINTSSVSIFNPLKLQSSPKNDRKSPKSPHSPKVKSNSPTTKRDKINLNFTPPNPFIPNLTSPTLNPNQFLYPSGPPGFPSYDPRVMAAYQSLWLGQRMGFPPSIAGLSLDLNQRKNIDIAAPPTSPKMGNLAQTSHSSQISTKLLTNTTATTSIHLSTPRTPNLQPSVSKAVPTAKKALKDSSRSSEKSLENAVEKLTQNRVKEIVKSEVSAGTTADKNSEKPDVQEKQNFPKTTSSGSRNSNGSNNNSTNNSSSNNTGANVSNENDSKKLEETASVKLNCKNETNSSSTTGETVVDSQLNVSSSVQTTSTNCTVKENEVRTSDNKPNETINKTSETDSNNKTPSVDETSGTNKNVRNNNTNSADLAEVAGAK